MGILDASVSAGGSSNTSQNSAMSTGSGVSDSWSRTYGTEASIRSAQEADRTNELQKNWFEKEMQFNREEAQKQRDFNELMANTLYTRSVENMKAAGINPILAANFGLSAANVNSGATASTSAPSAYMGQTFADQASASHSEWSSNSRSSGSSQGNSWNNSESGLATALTEMGKFIGDGLNALSSAKFFDFTAGTNTSKEVGKQIDKAIDKATGNNGIQFSDSAIDIAKKLLGGKNSKYANGGGSW